MYNIIARKETIAGFSCTFMLSFVSYTVSWFDPVENFEIDALLIYNALPICSVASGLCS